MFCVVVKNTPRTLTSSLFGRIDVLLDYKWEDDDGSLAPPCLRATRATINEQHAADVWPWDNCLLGCGFPKCAFVHCDAHRRRVPCEPHKLLWLQLRRWRIAGRYSISKVRFFVSSPVPQHLAAAVVGHIEWSPVSARSNGRYSRLWPRAMWHRLSGFCGSLWSL